MNPLPLGHCDLSIARPRIEALDPEDLIAGDPIIRYASLHQTSDGNTVGLRDFSAGRFRRRHGVEEVLHIVEGRATVIDEKHRVWSLREGDVVTFREGTFATWQVPEYLRALSFTGRAAAASPGLYRLRALQAAKMIGAALFGLALASTATTVTLAASMLAI
jgi:uncharacterized cupin superfamily protein